MNLDTFQSISRAGRRRLFQGLCGLILAMGALAATPASAQTKLVAAIEEDPSVINAAMTSLPSSAATSAPIYSALTHIPREGVIEPELAERWEISPDGKTYTFHLRKGVTWHDGKPFTSADVKFSIENFTMKLHPWGKVAYKVVESIDTPDDYTVVYHLKQPSASFMSATDFACAPILPKHIWEGTDFLKNPANQHPIGTGPYKFAEYIRGQSIRYVRNDAYFGAKKPYFDELIFRIIPDGATRLAALQSKEIDVIYWNAFPQSDAARLAAQPGIGLRKTTNRGAAYLGILNTRQAPLSDARVRRAIFLALDRKFMRENVDSGMTSAPMVGPLWPTSELINKALVDYPHDVAQANQLLDEAGVKRGPDGKRMTLSVLWQSSIIGAAKIAEIMQRNLNDVGIDVDLQPLDRGTLNQKAYVSNNFGLVIEPIVLGPDPDIGTERLFNSQNILNSPYVNNSAYANPELDKLFDEQRTKTNLAERKAIYDKIQEILWRDLPVIPFFTYAPNNAYRSSYVSGVFSETDHGSFENYVNAGPAEVKGAAAAPAAEAAGASSSWIALGVAVLALIALIVRLLARRRSKADDL
jgi:peptide/nickel transport system substrate-binding protein